MPRRPNPVIQRLDKLLRRIVLARDGVCRRCGAKPQMGRGNALQAAHVYGKGKYTSMRYDLRNVILLCQSCHYSWHEIGFGREASGKVNEVRQWCIEMLGKEHMDSLDLLSMHPGKVNRTLDELFLLQKLKEYEQ